MERLQIWVCQALRKCRNGAGACRKSVVGSKALSVPCDSAALLRAVTLTERQCEKEQVGTANHESSAVLELSRRKLVIHGIHIVGMICHHLAGSY